FAAAFRTAALVKAAQVVSARFAEAVGELRCRIDHGGYHTVTRTSGPGLTLLRVGTVQRTVSQARCSTEPNPMTIRVTVWGEYRHEKKNPKVAEIYPKGMHEAIASHLRKNSKLAVRTATLDEPEHGLSEEVLNS